jgi:hypothetical protein
MRLRPVLLLALLGFFQLAHAQTEPRAKPTPEEIQKMTDSTGAMSVVMGRMAEIQLEAQLKVAERPETAERIATFKKNLFDALRRKGFTAEQSLQIMNATSLPSMVAGGK